MTNPTRGPLMLNIEGPAITGRERERLRHPLVGGVILFARNYVDRAQLTALCAELHGLREPRLLIAIDHEGGRVQRCREGFEAIPPMAELGRWWDDAPLDALHGARAIGYLLAAELRDCGVDLSFTPVLDLEWGRSSVIGDRAFHGDPAVVAALAGALIGGLRDAGMAACGKHFPGHGWVQADSHVDIPVDERTLAAIRTDMQPFADLRLDGVMPAHVIYPAIDALPAGFSSAWHRILREDLRFDGAVFSDDLSMAGAGVVGDYRARADAAWQAGCDMLLLCNVNDAADAVLDDWQPASAGAELRAARVSRLLPGDKKNPADAALRAAGRVAVAAIRERIVARGIT